MGHRLVNQMSAARVRVTNPSSKRHSSGAQAFSSTSTPPETAGNVIVNCSGWYALTLKPTTDKNSYICSNNVRELPRQPARRIIE